jgi:tetratricopeptide (TPR) repeat protein
MIKPLVLVLLALTTTSCGRESTVVQKVTPVSQPPEGYGQAERLAIALAGEGKITEAEAIFDSWIEKYPDFREPHYQLAAALLFAAEDSKDQGLKPERQRQLERAATHFKRFVELADDAETRAQGLDSLVETYLPGNLNRPQEAEPHARALVAAAPESPQSYRQFAAVMRQLGRTDEATQSLLAARTSIATAFRFNFVEVLRKHVADSSTLRGAAAKQVIDAAMQLTDEHIAANRRTYANISMKAELLGLQAERVEESAQRQKALLAESERLHAEAAKLQ